MRLLLVGGSGMLGRAWRELLADRPDLTRHAPTHAELDLLDPRSIERHVTPEVRVVVNCAAWTDVDGAEARPDECMLLNATAVGTLARRCAAVGATLLHYSTDYVFGGTQPGTPVPVDHPTQPSNAYGRSKLEGEHLALASGCPLILVRTSWLYAPWGKNFVRTIAQLALNRPSLRVVNDQFGRPTSSEHLAQASLKLLESGASGLFHLSDGGMCTWFDLAVAVAAYVNPACRVEPCTSAEFPRPARRPAWSVLDLATTESVIGPLPDWRSTLSQVLPRLEGIA
jgi:dTDP-4-dehydrorhamnose reductase